MKKIAKCVIVLSALSLCATAFSKSTVKVIVNKDFIVDGGYNKATLIWKDEHQIADNLYFKETENVDWKGSNFADEIDVAALRNDGTIEREVWHQYEADAILGVSINLVQAGASCVSGYGKMIYAKADQNGNFEFDLSDAKSWVKDSSCVPTESKSSEKREEL